MAKFPRRMVLACAASLFAGVVVLACGDAYAQPTTGSLTVHVVDTGNQSLPGAVVIVTGGKRARKAVTGAEGRAYFPALAPGIYQAKAQLGTFPAATFPNIPIAAGREVAIEMTVQTQ
jgi:Carboxypeptidase regulatory-like domain